MGKEEGEDERHGSGAREGGRKGGDGGKGRGLDWTGAPTSGCGAAWGSPERRAVR